MHGFPLGKLLLLIMMVMMVRVVMMVMVTMTRMVMVMMKPQQLQTPPRHPSAFQIQRTQIQTNYIV